MIRLALLIFVPLLLASPAWALPARFELRITGNVSQVALEPVGTSLTRLIGELVETVLLFDANEATTGVPYNPAAPSAFELTSSFLSFDSDNATPSASLEVRFDDNGFDEIRVLAIAPLATGVFDPLDDVTGAILILTAAAGGAYNGIPQDPSLSLSDFDTADLFLFGSEQPDPFTLDDNWVLQVSLTGLSLTAVPEPGAAALLSLAGLALARRIRR